jgi:hypothetical protein
MTRPERNETKSNSTNIGATRTALIIMLQLSAPISQLSFADLARSEQNEPAAFYGWLHYYAFHFFHFAVLLPHFSYKFCELLFVMI